MGVYRSPDVHSSCRIFMESNGSFEGETPRAAGPLSAFDEKGCLPGDIKSSLCSRENLFYQAFAQ